MTRTELNKGEIRVLNESIEKRKSTLSNSNFDQDTHEELVALQNKLKVPFIRLTPTEKSKLIGCIEDSHLRLNSDLLNLDGLQLLFLPVEERTILESLDDILKIKNKLLRKSEKPNRLFQNKIAPYEKLLSASRVYYSAMSDGNIYKAVITVDGKGINLSLDINYSISKTKIEQVSGNICEEWGKPAQVLSSLQRYEADQNLTEAQKTLKHLIQLMIAKTT